MDPHPLRLSMTLQEGEGSALLSGRFNTSERAFMSHYSSQVDLQAISHSAAKVSALLLGS